MNKNTIPFEKDIIKAYLDRCIRLWRTKLEHNNKYAEYYIDAFQSVRMTIFGETLPREDLEK